MNVVKLRKETQHSAYYLIPKILDEYYP